jgi:FtsZ-interacting cell division protein ZipA
VDTTVLVLIIVVIVLVLALAIGGFMLAKARRSQQLQDRHGPEYERSLSETGDRRAAEAQLAEREARRRKLDVRDLSPDERQHFGAAWTEIQRGFVDDPVRAVREADGLVVDIMRTRGFPADDADRRTDDVAVDHPEIAQRYRDARAVRNATAQGQGQVDTETQRHAVTSYRDLVEALLGDEHSQATASHMKEQNR